LPGVAFAAGGGLTSHKRTGGRQDRARGCIRFLSSTHNPARCARLGIQQNA
jgi:hypothetical protein